MSSYPVIISNTPNDEKTFHESIFLHEMLWDLNTRLQETNKQAVRFSTLFYRKSTSYVKWTYHSKYIFICCILRATGNRRFVSLQRKFLLIILKFASLLSPVRAQARARTGLAQECVPARISRSDNSSDLLHFVRFVSLATFFRPFFLNRRLEKNKFILTVEIVLIIRTRK